MFARHSKNEALRGLMENMINCIGVSKIPDPIDTTFLILNITLADPAMFLSS